MQLDVRKAHVYERTLDMRFLIPAVTLPMLHFPLCVRNKTFLVYYSKV